MDKNMKPSDFFIMTFFFKKFKCLLGFWCGNDAKML